MKKVKHYWGRNRTGRRLRCSMPRWMRLVVTFTETYNPSIANFLERWGSAIRDPQPEEPMLIYAIDKDTGVDGLYEVHGLYTKSSPVMDAISEQVKDGTTIINFDGGFAYEPTPEVKKIVEASLLPLTPMKMDY